MYETILQIANEQSDTIVQRTIEIMQTKYDLRPQHSEQLEQTMLGIKLVLQMQLGCLTNNDLDGWKQFVVTGLKYQMEQGVSYIDVSKVGQSLTAALSEFFDEQLATKAQTDPEADATLKRLQRRLRSLNMVALSTATATGIKEIKRS